MPKRQFGHTASRADAGVGWLLEDVRVNETGTVGQPDSDEIAALRALVEGTARGTGQEFFASLVTHLARAVGTRYAFVAEFVGPCRARTLAFWFRDGIAENVEWDVRGTGPFDY